jgi:hypothetical protein
VNLQGLGPGNTVGDLLKHLQKGPIPQAHAVWTFPGLAAVEQVSQTKLGVLFMSAQGHLQRQALYVATSPTDVPPERECLVPCTEYRGHVHH